MGIEEGWEVVKGQRSEVAAIERVGVEVEHGFAGGGSGGGDNGFWETCADDDEVECVGLNRRVRRRLGHGCVGTAGTSR